MSLKRWARLAAHPALPELREKIESLRRLKDEAGEEDVKKIEDKIALLTGEFDGIRRDTEKTMRDIVQGHEDLRTIRRRTGRETVPWKIMVK